MSEQNKAGATLAEPTVDTTVNAAQPVEDSAVKAAPTAPAAEGEQERNRRKVLTGTVVSDKMDKTIVVAVEDRVKHPLYGKVMRKTSRIKVHDETNDAGIGDRVRVMETRPLSATKRWRLVKVVERAK